MLKDFWINESFTRYRYSKIKIKDQGKTCMFLGYSQNHTSGTYHMLNLCSKRIVLSRDVIWINKTYGEYISGK